MLCTQRLVAGGFIADGADINRACAPPPVVVVESKHSSRGMRAPPVWWAVYSRDMQHLADLLSLSADANAYDDSEVR